jgi:prepilin-type N-terminal cleavage/methylation domain-containing protein
MRRPRPVAQKNNGFTIIEILIVLAVAGSILLIIFLVVPTLRKNARNYQRKVAVDYVRAMMEDYTTTHGGKFPYYGTPATDSARIGFINQLKTEGPAMQFDFTYSDSGQSHHQPYDLGWDVSDNTVFIMPGHFASGTLPLPI